MRSALGDFFDLVLPSQVIVESGRHLTHPTQAIALKSFLVSSEFEELPMPTAPQVRLHGDLVRSDKGVPIALALLIGDVDIFVTSDRDFTDPSWTAERFRKRVRVMLPAVFLRDVLGWSSEALEAIRDCGWEDLDR